MHEKTARPGQQPASHSQMQQLLKMKRGGTEQDRDDMQEKFAEIKKGLLKIRQMIS